MDYRPVIGEGVYTVPDASHILKFPQAHLRRWVNGYWQTIPEAQKKRMLPVVDTGIWGQGRELAFNFYALIEIYTIKALRELGVSFRKIRRAREELAKRFDTKYPFASHKLMSDGKQILVEFKQANMRALLELDTHGQIVIERVIKPFCKKLTFNMQTYLAELYRPLGKKTSIIVSPHYGFGRPTIEGTNIATETIYNFITAGEDKRTIAKLFDISLTNIDEVIKFEQAA